MVPPLSAGPRDKDVRPWDLLIWLNPFDLALQGFPEVTPLFSVYTALKKELKQTAFPTVQMALAIIKVVPKTGGDVCEQGKMQSIVDLMSEQVGIVSQVPGPLKSTPAKWMVRLLETQGVLVKGFNFIADIHNSIQSGSFISNI